MGLDMYIIRTDVPEPKEHDLEQEADLEYFMATEVAYWRKHPNLHGYIVNTFADGDDNCQPIQLTEERILDILDAVETNRLPDTSGFFFGKTRGDEGPDDKAKLTKALELVRSGVPLIYEASW